jgi:hypothetical protein
MAHRLLSTVKFEDASEFDEYLYDLLSLTTNGEDEEYPVVLVEDSNGNALNIVKLYEGTLTDGSKVYKIVLDREIHSAVYCPVCRAETCLL